MKKKITSKKKSFFYAESKAGMYDDTIEFVVPQYRLIHKTIIDLLRFHFPDNVSGTILDVGAGTGAESLAVLKTFRNTEILAIDFCKPMKKVFEDNYINNFGNCSPRYEFVIEDILDPKCNNKFLKSKLNQRSNSNCIGVISAYCIHHFTAKEKKVTYKKLYDILEPGGILVNADLYTYSSTNLSLNAHKFDINFIQNQFDNPDDAYIHNKIISKKDRVTLKNKWIHHMNNDNILNTMDLQLKMLKEIGFKETECIFRYLQQGIIYAVK